MIYKIYTQCSILHQKTKFGTEFEVIKTVIQHILCQNTINLIKNNFVVFYLNFLPKTIILKLIKSILQNYYN